MRRVVVFIDAQNMYHGARNAFGSRHDPRHMGQFCPHKLAQYLVSQTAEGVSAGVRVYTGRPSPRKDPRTNAAHLRQCAAWERAGVKVIHRGLRYPHDWPSSPAVEKGIDVALAIDLVAMAMDGKYDLGVVCSADTDLAPAIELVYDRLRTEKVGVQTAFWWSPSCSHKISIDGVRRVWNNRLDDKVFARVCDLRDYSRE